MRIAYMLTSLGIGGAEKQVIAIGERMAARGHDVALIVLRPAEKQECPTNLPVHHIGMRKSAPGFITGLARARGVLRSCKPDLLHSHTFPANMVARALRSIGSAPPVLATVHNIYEGARHRTLAYRLTDPFCTHATAISRKVAEHYIEMNAVPRDKCSVILNGIDLEQFSSASSAVKAQTNETCAEFVWLAAGRDVPAKDFDTLLAAFARVRAAFPNAQLRIAGRPAPRRSDDRAAGVRWLGVSDNMPGTLAQCDAFVLSSAWEGMPLVLGEAMAMEKPFVATDVGGVSELAGSTGLIVQSHNPQAIAEAMLQIMRLSKAERHAMGTAARRRMIEHFDINAKADEWEALYAGVLSSK